MNILALLLIIVGVSGVLARHEKYAGWKTYDVEPQNYGQLQNLTKIIPKFHLDFLNRPGIKHTGLVLVMPEYQDAFTQFLEQINLPYNVHDADVMKALQYKDQLMRNRNKSSKSEGFTFDKYHTVDVYENHLRDIAKNYPDIVTLVEPKRTYEGRTIQYVKISTTNFEDTSKPVIFIDGTIHAREWITAPTVMWAIHKLVINVTEPDLLERFDWVLLPIVNPDGYEYSLTIEPIWRKTRAAIPNSSCLGVDGNRNYDFFWGTMNIDGGGPCDYDYPGHYAFSEVETQVVRDILHEHLSRMAMYITVHSAGSMILYPWGHDGTLSNNALALHTVGIAMADAIHANTLSFFPRYVVGNSAQVLYGVSGAAEDYAHSIGVPLTYCIELPIYGGLETYIEQVCRETWEGLVVGARRAGDLYVPLP